MQHHNPHLVQGQHTRHGHEQGSQREGVQHQEHHIALEQDGQSGEFASSKRLSMQHPTNMPLVACLNNIAFMLLAPA